MSSETRSIGRTCANMERKSGIVRRQRQRRHRCFCALFTEQGAFASHMTAGKVLDTISGLPGRSGEAKYAATAFTQVEMNDADCFSFQRRNAQQVVSGYLEIVDRNIGIILTTQLVPLQRCYGKEIWKKSCCKKSGRRYSTGNKWLDKKKKQLSF